MFIIRDEARRDEVAREALLDAAFGSERHEKTCERLREGRLAAHGLSLVAEVGGRIIGTVRLWHVKAGDRDALLLGPLAVDSDYRAHGIGARLMRLALNRAALEGYRAVVLVGEPAYYVRFGFSDACMVGLDLPGPVDRARFLGLELRDGALSGAAGLVTATGDVDAVHFVQEAAESAPAFLQAA